MTEKIMSRFCCHKAHWCRAIIELIVYENYLNLDCSRNFQSNSDASDFSNILELECSKMLFEKSPKLLKQD